MMGPGGGTLKAAGSYLFLGDETALPAIARMLEELPAEANARAFIEIADTAERQRLPMRSGVDVQWLSREGRPAGSTNLLADALRSALPDMPRDDVYVWAAGEHRVVRQMRSDLKERFGLPKKQYLCAAYWRIGAAGELPD